MQDGISQVIILRVLKEGTKKLKHFYNRYFAKEFTIEDLLGCILETGEHVHECLGREVRSIYISKKESEDSSAERYIVLMGNCITLFERCPNHSKRLDSIRTFLDKQDVFYEIRNNRFSYGDLNHFEIKIY